MTENQKRFCNEYIKDYNATRAYKAVYPSCKKDETAKAAASRLLTNVNLQQYIEKLQKNLTAKMNITQERVIQEIARIAFGDIRNLYNENGGLKNIKDMDDDTAAIIQQLETFQEFDGYGEDREYVGDTKKVKLYSKEKALDMLGKYFGIFKEKIEIDSEKPFEVNINIRKK